MAHVTERAAWAADDRWQGEITGIQIGAGLSLIFNDFDTVGRGPRLHRHPYAETFIMRSGNALFTVGDQQIRASAGQILVVPPNVPHTFENLGPGRLETIDIHENPEFITEWLE